MGHSTDSKHNPDSPAEPPAGAPGAIHAPGNGGNNAALTVQITLNAVLAAIETGEPKVLCTDDKAGTIALPYGPFDPVRHRTFEVGLRDWVNRQTRVSPGYVEQLYTFGDRGREAPLGGDPDDQPSPNPSQSGDLPNHLVSVGYLALAPAPAAVNVADAKWRNWYQFFPWEDWRGGEPEILAQVILPVLKDWIDQAGDKRAALLTRVRTAFGFTETGWEEERILERFELMFQAGLVLEAHAIDEGLSSSTATPCGLAMASDHRRILATAIGRLRGKLKYRPILYDMVPNEFTLLDLQTRVEAISGFALHKQNFRRMVENSGQIEPTGGHSSAAGGRPAALFCVNRASIADRADKGLTIPRLKRRPSFDIQ